ncbi:MAG: acyl dehydratase [Chloroflexota bacterium]|nr:MAG: acyl dehydratase [Chloroflexota bacterium]
MPEASITTELIDEMRSKIGLKLRTDASVSNEVATRLAILKFAEGIGDPNPLWSDGEYARKTQFGEIVAPPSFVWACCSHVQFGWKGLGGFHSGCDIEFYRPVYQNDTITAEVVFTGFDGPKASEFADEMVIDHFDNKYWNNRDELVAKYHYSIVRIARPKAREKGKYSSIALPHPWRDDELKRIEEEVLSEAIRGSDPRYWEDVEVGEELRPVVKGPLGLTDELAFFLGGATPIPRLSAHGMGLRQYRKHSMWAFRDPHTYALEPIFAVHYNREAARAMGVPMQYDVGIQRHCWGIHLLTNWMGDNGWIKRSRTEYRQFVYFSDVVWLKGKVTRKYIDDNGDHCVDIERHAINQRDLDVMPGWATVALPSREKGISPLDGRLRR